MGHYTSLLQLLMIISAARKVFVVDGKFNIIKESEWYIH